MEASSAPLTRSSRRAGLVCIALGSLTAVVLFRVIFTGQMPKWPIYVIILMWWFFIIYMFVRINRQNEAPVFRDELSDCNEV